MTRTVRPQSKITTRRRGDAVDFTPSPGGSSLDRPETPPLLPAGSGPHICLSPDTPDVPRGPQPLPMAPEGSRASWNCSPDWEVSGGASTPALLHCCMGSHKALGSYTQARLTGR